jgi:hypothetical protein
VEPNRRSLETIIRNSVLQGLLPVTIPVDDLFTDLTRDLK